MEAAIAEGCYIESSSLSQAAPTELATGDFGNGLGVAPPNTYQDWEAERVSTAARVAI
jgi:hypothetical protein